MSALTLMPNGPMVHATRNPLVGIDALSDSQITLRATPAQIPGKLLSQGRTRTCAHWLTQDPKAQGYLSEVVVKLPHAIRYQIRTWTSVPTSTALLDDALQYGHVSPRPYRLAQAQDGSVTRCVLALFAEFCLAAGFQPRAVISQAHPLTQDEQLWSPAACTELLQHAHWETIDYPEKWDALAIRGLIESLHEIRWHCLASYLAFSFDGRTTECAS